MSEKFPEQIHLEDSGDGIFWMEGPPDSDEAETAIYHREDHPIEALRDEMKKIALAVGRSKTDGEEDCDWAFLGDEVAERILMTAVMEREACMSICISMLFDFRDTEYQHGHNQALLEAVKKMRLRASGSQAKE